MLRFNNPKCAALLIACFSAFMLWSCESNPSGPDTDVPPELPPTTSMVIPFDAFSNGTLTQHGDALEVVTKQNFGFAATTIVFWNAAVTLTMAIPVASFLAAANQDFEFIGDATWEATYTFNPPGGVQHTARLQAKLGDNVEWKMYISKQNSFTDFLWFSGESELNNTEGTWTLYRSPSNPTKFIDILWHANPEESTGDIKYTYAVPDVPENGNSIFYGVTNETPYDAFYIIFNNVIDSETVIEWNRETTAGRVKSEPHFGDDSFHCWDTLANGLEDVDCESAGPSNAM